MGDDEGFIAPAEVRPIDIAIVGLDLCRNLLHAVETAVANTESLLMMHANHLAEKRAFADEARLSIETITNEE